MGVASGMFYVLAGGVVLACIVFVIEWVHHRRYKATANKHEVNLKTLCWYTNMSYGATVGASAANSNIIEFKK